MKQYNSLLFSKEKIASCALLILFSLKANAQQPLPVVLPSTITVNHIREWDATAPDQSASHLLTRGISDVKQTTKYLDGFGRIIQNVAKNASPLGNDVISAHTYDPATGNEIYNYLPFTSNVATSGDVTNDGDFKLDPFQEQVAFYNTYLSGQQGETNVGGNSLNWAYTKTNYETSPINRPLNTFAPGTNWVGSEGTLNHNVKLLSLLNTSVDNVQKWNIAPWDITAPQTNIIPTSSGSYLANQLYKKIVTDEQGHQSIEFKDKYGQIVLKKVQLSSTTTDNGTGSAHSGWLCTYYVYDDLGNLRFVITPKEVSLIDGIWTISLLQSDELCYRYEYDVYNHMVVKKIPGTPTGNTGEAWIVYDQRNRIVMQQDPNLRSEQKWQYFQYDNLDRPASTGLITDLTNYNNLNYHVTNAATSSNSGGYSAWPVLTSYTIKELMSQTFYDDYSWMNSTNSSTLTSSLDATSNGAGNTNFVTTYSISPYPQQIAKSNMTRGAIMGSKSEILDGSGYLYSVNFYDSKGKQVQVQSLNITNGKDIITTQYDWSGKVLNNLVSSQYVSSTNLQTHNIFTLLNYDAMGRLLTVKKLVNSTINGPTVNSANYPTPLTIVSNTYDELGKLKSKQLAPYFTNFNASGIEKLTYDFNVRGWQLGANRDYVKTPLSTSNYFGYDLGYDKMPIIPTGGSSIGSYTTAAFNGNIEGVVWKSKGDGVARKYDYGYDIVGRLASAPYSESTVINSWGHSTIDFSVSNIGYDANGNIGTMQQNGFLVGGSQPIDNFTYTYMNSSSSNRLLNVADNSTYNSANSNSILGDLHYTGSKTVSTIDYVYDNNGNVITDNNRFSTITYWDYNNMPKLVTVAGTKNGSTIQYIYDAAGDKLKKITTDKSVAGKTIVTTTTYIGGLVYKTVATNPIAPTDFKDILQYIGHEEGRIRYIPGTPASFVFDYFIPDHLGNVRMVLTDESQIDYFYPATLENTTVNNGTAISQESLYYNINTSDVVPNPSWLASASGGSYINENNNGYPPTPNNNNNSDKTATSQKIYQLCGNTGNNPTGDRYGLGITLKVMAGDRITIYGKSVWHLPSGQTTIPTGSYTLTSILSTFLNSFANTSAAIAGSHGALTGSTIYNNATSNSTVSSFLNNSNNPVDPTKTPKAGICWILFDDQFRPIATSGGSGFDPVNTTSDVVKTHPLVNIPMIQNGYLYVFCSNESNINVYFDNLQVTNSRGPAVEETHYYPYGLAMAGISDRAWNKQINFEHYQGKEMQDMEFADGSGLEEYDFEARYYDPQIGRWHSPDPVDQFGSPYSAMENNPTLYTDPDGECPICVAIILGAMIGGFSEGIHSDMQGKTFLGGFLRGAIVGGIGGALGGEFGGGTFLNNVLWGAGEGAFTGGLNSVINGDDFGSGALSGAEWGGALAAISSGVESFKNLNSGYGFGTNDGRFNQLVNESVISKTGSGLVDAVKAQKALDFWELRFGGPHLTYDPLGTSPNTTPLGKISMVEKSFIEGPGSLRRSIAHEMGHYLFNVNWDNKVGGSISNPKWINLDQTQYGGDGVFGYRNAINNWGKYHIGYDAISRGRSAIYVTPAWKNFGVSKWFHGLPGRNTLFGINIF
jgi:RHS repeat-associated protein